MKGVFSSLQLQTDYNALGGEILVHILHILGRKEPLAMQAWLGGQVLYAVMLQELTTYTWPSQFELHNGVILVGPGTVLSAYGKQQANVPGCFTFDPSKWA